MTKLRQRMLEELQRRNYSPITIRCCLRVVEDFARYFETRPDRLSQEHLKQYHLHLIRERKLAIKTVGLHIAALRFFFVKTLRRPYLKLDLPHIDACPQCGGEGTISYNSAVSSLKDCRRLLARRS